MKLSGAIRIFFILVIATYPFIIYFGIQILPPGFFGLVLVTLLAVFAASLRSEPLLLRIVRASGMPISRYGPACLFRGRYKRRMGV